MHADLLVETQTRLDEIFAGAAARGWLHASTLDGSQVIDRGADEPVPIASLYKIVLALVWADDVDCGRRDPRARLRLGVGGRTPGPTGLSVLLDEVQVSERDLVRLMLTLSDNAAADHLLDLVGVEMVGERVRSWGLTNTVVRRGSRAALERTREETAAPTLEETTRRLADLDDDVTTSEYDPAFASVSTAQELTRVLRLAWNREIAGGEAGSFVRESMRLQVWPHRLRSGFPHDDVQVAGKTGTFGLLRHEIGVVEFPEEVPLVVAVLTRAARPERHLPRVDAAIGEAARTAVWPLRRALLPDPS